MTSVRIPGGILTLSDESAPFLFRGKRYAISKQWGPFRCDRYGDPLKNQPIDGLAARELQAAYEYYLRGSNGI